MNTFEELKERINYYITDNGDYVGHSVNYGFLIYAKTLEEFKQEAKALLKDTIIMAQHILDNDESFDLRKLTKNEFDSNFPNWKLQQSNTTEEMNEVTERELKEKVTRISEDCWGHTDNFTNIESAIYHLVKEYAIKSNTTEENERELLINFFMYFREFGEKNIGMTIEQLVDEFLKIKSNGKTNNYNKESKTESEAKRNYNNKH